MSTESIPTAEASSTDTPKRTVADEYRDAQAALKKERRNMLFWLAWMSLFILNFAARVAVLAAGVATSHHDLWNVLWLIWAIAFLPLSVWMYSRAVARHTRAAHRKSLAEAAVLKEATKPATDK